VPHETAHQITTLLPPHTTTAHLAHQPSVTPTEIPPGVELVTLPNGVRTLAYTQPTTSAPAAPAIAAAQPVPVWAKTTALLAPTIGAGVAAAGLGLSYAAPGLIAMAHALWAAVALIATGGLAAAALLGRVRRQAPARITQNITAHGFMSRATGTIHHH
jgi:hypothetical protein